MAPEVVWLKRDLRLDDHRALAEAAARGPVLLLYIWEPELIAQPETDARHWTFVRGSLDALDEALRPLGGRVVERVGDAVEVLARLHAETGFSRLYGHEETGLLWTYDRDRAVRRWCRRRGVTWSEHRQFGVFRALADRDGWARRWQQEMSRPLATLPEDARFVDLPDSPDVPAFPLEALSQTLQRAWQTPGEEAAQATLASFLSERGRDYPRAMSSPVTAWEQCSRLSPYLAYGNLSLRRLFRATTHRAAAAVRSRDPEERAWARSLKAYGERLRWHCHFIQKIESEPEAERRNLNRAYDGMRNEDPSRWSSREREHFEAWRQGRTGYPMVDAVMRCLEATGWINFRMRAMVVSFACHHLWLHWHPVARELARRFVDFEPGIHFAQVQMQAGTTGISTNRIYAPTKQALDHDPVGVFIRRWVPELAAIPTAHLAEPWRMGPMEQRMHRFVIGEDYPAPLVDHLAAVRRAKAAIARVKHSDEARDEAQRVFLRHGSRRGPRARRRA